MIVLFDRHAVDRADGQVRRGDLARDRLRNDLLVQRGLLDQQREKIDLKGIDAELPLSFEVLDEFEFEILSQKVLQREQRPRVLFGADLDVLLRVGVEQRRDEVLRVGRDVRDVLDQTRRDDVLDDRPHVAQVRFVVRREERGLLLGRQRRLDQKDDVDITVDEVGIVDQHVGRRTAVQTNARDVDRMLLEFDQHLSKEILGYDVQGWK